MSSWRCDAWCVLCLKLDRFGRGWCKSYCTVSSRDKPQILGRDETDHDLLHIIIAQRTDSLVYQTYSVRTNLWLVPRDRFLEAVVVPLGI